MQNRCRRYSGPETSMHTRKERDDMSSLSMKGATMNNIDLTIQKMCSTCKTEMPFRYFGNGLLNLGDHSNMELRVDPDESSLCPTCGNPLRLYIQAYPYELVNHLDTPVATMINRRKGFTGKKVAPQRRKIRKSS